MLQPTPYIRNRAFDALLIFLLVFMPYSTFVLQAARYTLESRGVSLGDTLTLLSVGWKELILAALGFGVAVYLVRFRRVPFRIHYLDWLILAFMLYGVVVGGLEIRSIKPVVFGMRYDYFVFLFYFAGRFCWFDRQKLERTLKTISLASIPMLLFGLAQVTVLPYNFLEKFGYSWGMRVSGNPLPPYHFIAGDLLRAMSTFPGPNSLAMYSVFLLFILLFFGRAWWKKGWWLAACLLAAAVCIVTYSRGHLASLAVALLMGWMLRLAWVRAYKLRMQVMASAFILMFLVAGLWISVASLSPASNTNMGKWQALVFHNTSSEIHRDVRLQAWDSIKAQPFGSGLGTSGLATTNTGGKVFNPESWYIQITQELGWPGLGLALIVICGLYAWMVNMYFTFPDPRDQRTAMFFIVSFTAIVFSAQFLPSWFEVASISWWVLFGLFVSDFDRSFEAA